MKHTVKEWFCATRYWSFPVSAMPVAAAGAYLAWKGYNVEWVYALLALVGNVIFHAAGNVLSDWWDYRKGVDNEEAYAIPNLVFHQFEPAEYLKFSALLFGAGIAIGLLLTFLCGWKLLIIGIIGFILAASYSFFKFRGMGDIFVFTCFGVLPVIGTSFVATGMIDWSILVLSVPLGVFTIAVLHNNNTVDIATDKASGIHTLPMLLGEKVSVKLYIAYMVIPYLAVVVFCILGLLPVWALLCILSAPAAYKNASAALGYFCSAGSAGSAGRTGSADGAGSVGSAGSAGSAGYAGGTGSADGAGPVGSAGYAGGTGSADGAGPVGSAGSAGSAGSGFAGGAEKTSDIESGKKAGREALIGLDQKTAQLHLIFSVTLSIGLALAAII